MLQRRRTQADILMGLSMIFYGVSFPMTKTALRLFGPITIVTARLFISALVLMTVNVMRSGNGGLPKKGDWPIFILIALFQPLGYFLFETFGLQYVSASIASILIATIPVFTPVVSRFGVSERLTVYNLAGLFISFLGVVILVTAAGTGGDTAGPGGVLLMFGAVFSAVFYTILVKRLPNGYSPLTITAVRNSLGLIMFIPLFFVFEYDPTSLGSVLQRPGGPEAVMSIVFLAIFASSLAFIFMNHGIRVIGPSRANGLVNLIPVITAVVSLLFFGERFTLQKALGMAVVFAGVMLSQHPAEK